ncbi:MAG: hypothetical protein CML68_21245 [Rhodobacteraceae bacterium]|nr:hypothetical protein [Paracoccaceae bacterium]
MSNTIRRSVFALPVARLHLRAYYDLWRQRRQLAKLDDSALTDIGIRRDEALREAARPFWDAPTHWRR